jgi:PAS domain S-box-containing protein
MEDYGHLTRAELVSLIRELKAAQVDAGGPAGKKPAEFPVFSVWHQREFGRSPWPMRIFEHGTFRFLAVNDAAVKLYGYSREEFLAMTARDTRHPEELDDFLTTLDEPTSYFRHRGPRRHTRKNGEIIVVEAVTQDILFHGRKARLSMNIDVTERNKAEEEVRRQKQLLETVINNIPTRIFIRDAKTLRYVMRNRFSEEASGHPIGSSIGKSVYDLYPREYADLLSSTDAEALKTGRLVEIPEFRVTGKSGEPRIRHVRKVPVFDENGQPWVLVGISEDITERKRAEDALRESNEFLRSVVESSRDCIKVLDLEGRLQWISAGGQHLMEIEDAKPLLQKSYPDFWSGADREAASNAVAAARSGGTSRFEGYCPTCKGTPKWWDEIVAPMLGKDGRTEKLLVVSRDITAQKHAEQTLDESRQRLAWVLNVTGIGTWMNSLPLGKLNWDDRTRELFFVPTGVDPTIELFWERVHPEDRESTRLAVEASLRDRALYAIDHRAVNPVTGEIRWIRSAGKATYGANGAADLFDGINYDITDRKQQEQEQLNHAIHQRDALVREVHHRIKNSLQGVAGLLRQKVRKYPAIVPGIEEAIAQLQSVAVVYGIQGMHPDGMLGLWEMMKAISFSTERLIGGRVDLRLKRESPQPACVAGSEAVSVAVALNELVFNALKHQRADAGKKRARVALHETEDAAEIRISNRGLLPKGFDFARGRALGDGLGLVRTLLASPGGSIAFNGGRDEVEVVLKLGPPLLADRKRTPTRSIENGSATEERGAAAHTGGRRRPARAGRAG